MNVLNIIRKFFMDYLVPCTILIGSLLLFIILSSILFHIKRFYLFILLFFTVLCLIVSLFVTKQKIVRAIHVLCAIFFLTMLGLVAKLSIFHNNPWALVYKIHDTSDVAKNLYFQPTKFTNFPTKTNLFTTYLNLELKSLFNTTTPVTEKLFGFTITFHSYTYLAFLFREIFIDQDYYIALNNTSPMIIDCGCNEGLSILFFKMIYPNAKIIGFEAHPKSFDILRKNIDYNKIPQVTLVNKAIYNTEGPITFSSTNNLGSQILNNAKAEDCIVVQSTLLSTYINAPIDLLKMDIEGAESPVIEELAQHKKLKFIKHIIMEFHAYADKNHNNLAKTLCTLEDNGFSYQMKKFNSTVQIGLIHAYQN